MHLSHHSTFNCLSEARSTFFSEGVIFPILKMDDLSSLLIFFGSVLFFWQLLDRENPVGVVLIAPTCVDSYDRTFKAASFTLDWVHALWPRWHFWETARLRSPPLLLTASWMKHLLLRLICLLEAMINLKTQKIHQEKLTNRVYTYKGPYQSSNIQHEGRVCLKMLQTYDPCFGLFFLIYLFFLTMQASPFFKIRD